MVKPGDTSAPSSMAEGDDLMNLGPFIKNYVFNAQPLHNLSLIAKLDQNQHNDDVIDKSDVIISRDSPKIESESQRGVDVCRPIQNNNGVGQSLPYKKRNWDSSGWSPPKLKNGPKYLSEKQAKIKTWLAANYTYCPRHKNAKVSSRGVLARAVKEFGPLTQKALGFLMYQAFPGVERMKDTRKGHIFKGIMDRNQKRSRSRKDRSSSPPSRPVSRDPSRDSSRDQDKFDDVMEEDENEAPLDDDVTADVSSGRASPRDVTDDRLTLEPDDDHRRANYELVEVKMEPGADYHDVNGSVYGGSGGGMDLRTSKPPVLKQEPEYAPSEPYDDRNVAVSPVSDDCTPVPLVLNYPLLRQSLRHAKPGQFVPATELYYPLTADTRTLLDTTSTVFHHPHHHPLPQPVTTSHLNTTTTTAAAAAAGASGYYKLPQTLPEAHEQLAYLLRYVHNREEKLTHVEKQFHNLTVEFQKMAAMLREFHVDQVEFFKKVGYSHSPSCDGNNN